MLAVPSLKPIRLRGVAWALEVVDVRPKPSCDQRTVTSPRPMRARLRTAWKATCGSFAQAWTQRSPPERSASSASPGRSGSSLSFAGRYFARPKRSRLSNSDAPKPKVTVRFAGVRSIASPVSSGGASGEPAGPPPTGCPPAIVRGGLGPLLHQVPERPAIDALLDVERREVQPILRRRGDPRLMLAVEVHDMRIPRPGPTAIRLLPSGIADTRRGSNRGGSTTTRNERTSGESHN